MNGYFLPALLCCAQVAHSFPQVPAQSIRAFASSEGALSKVSAFLDGSQEDPRALYFFCDKGQHGLRSAYTILRGCIACKHIVDPIEVKIVPVTVSCECCLGPLCYKYLEMMGNDVFHVSPHPCLPRDRCDRYPLAYCSEQLMSFDKCMGQPITLLNKALNNIRVKTSTAAYTAIPKLITN